MIFFFGIQGRLILSTQRCFNIDLFVVFRKRANNFMSSRPPQIYTGAESTSSHDSVLNRGASGLMLAVTRNQLRAQVLNQTKCAVDHFAEENEMMEEILAEEHRMVSNSDLSRIMGVVVGTGNESAILASRKPTSREMLPSNTRRIGPGPSVSVIDTVEAANHNKPSTGKVNYAVLLEQQKEVHDRNAIKHQTYSQMINSFVQKQQRLHERFSGIV